MWGQICTESSYQLNFNFGFSTYKSDILLHLSQWQYWWWFWFSFFWSFYYFIIVRVVKNRVTKMNLKINTSLRGRGKWGDFLVALLPLSWCANILLNSNFILRMFEWQNESSLFTVRIHGKQWYWIYKFDLMDVIDILTVPKNMGRNRWVIGTPQEIIVCDSYLQAMQLRAKQDWINTYWKKKFDEDYTTFKNVQLDVSQGQLKVEKEIYYFDNKDDLRVEDDYKILTENLFKRLYKKIFLSGLEFIIYKFRNDMYQEIFEIKTKLYFRRLRATLNKYKIIINKTYPNLLHSNFVQKKTKLFSNRIYNIFKKGYKINQFNDNNILNINIIKILLFKYQYKLKKSINFNFFDFNLVENTQLIKLKSKFTDGLNKLFPNRSYLDPSQAKNNFGDPNAPRSDSILHYRKPKRTLMNELYDSLVDSSIFRNQNNFMRQIRIKNPIRNWNFKLYSNFIETFPEVYIKPTPKSISPTPKLINNYVEWSQIISSARKTIPSSIQNFPNLFTKNVKFKYFSELTGIIDPSKFYLDLKKILYFPNKNFSNKLNLNLLLIHYKLLNINNYLGLNNLLFKKKFEFKKLSMNLNNFLYPSYKNLFKTINFEKLNNIFKPSVHKYLATNFDLFSSKIVENVKVIIKKYNINFIKQEIKFIKPQQFFKNKRIELLNFDKVHLTNIPGNININNFELTPNVYKNIASQHDIQILVQKFVKILNIKKFAIKPLNIEYYFKYGNLPKFVNNNLLSEKTMNTLFIKKSIKNISFDDSIIVFKKNILKFSNTLMDTKKKIYQKGFYSDNFYIKNINESLIKINSLLNKKQNLFNIFNKLNKSLPNKIIDKWTPSIKKFNFNKSLLVLNNYQKYGILPKASDYFKFIDTEKFLNASKIKIKEYLNSTKLKITEENISIKSKNSYKEFIQYPRAKNVYNKINVSDIQQSLKNELIGIITKITLSLKKIENEKFIKFFYFDKLVPLKTSINIKWFSNIYDYFNIDTPEQLKNKFINLKNLNHTQNNDTITKLILKLSSILYKKNTNDSFSNFIQYYNYSTQLIIRNHLKNTYNYQFIKNIIMGFKNLKLLPAQNIKEIPDFNEFKILIKNNIRRRFFRNIDVFEEFMSLNVYNENDFEDNLDTNVHYDYDELDDTWDVENSIRQQSAKGPLRLVKHLLTPEYLKTESDLLKFNFFDNNDETSLKIPDNNNFWVLKQKRYKKKQIINPSKITDVEYTDFETVRNLYKKHIFQNIQLITDLDFKMNPYELYKCIRGNRHRTETLPIYLYRRLLRTKRTLVLPAHVNMTVVTNSYDVVHSWFLPGLGIKMDCVPGRSTHHSLYLDNIGFYYGQCAEICGRYHHHMPIRLCALPFEHFLIWWNIKGLPKFLKLKKEKDFVVDHALLKYTW